ncbi:MAG: hypothetical protein V3V01_09225 [Acidimicrobiales bacterium]
MATIVEMLDDATLLKLKEVGVPTMVPAKSDRCWFIARYWHQKGAEHG